MKSINKIDDEIEALKRRKRELKSAEKTEVRKIRTRGLIIAGGILMGRAERDETVHKFLQSAALSLKERDQELLRAAFPQIFTAQQQERKDEN